MRDYETYYKLMSANIQEKIDFIIDELIEDKSYTRVVDFGCADSQVTRALANIFPTIEFIGLDCNQEVIRSNNKNNSINNIDYVCTKDIDINDMINENTLVIFSSVFHEIYSFCEQDEIDQLLSQLLRAKSVAIRDMICLPTEYNKDVADKIYDVLDKKQLYEFAKSKHDVILEDDLTVKNFVMTDNKLISEFLLKSQYIRNWKEELKEDYFAVDWKAIDKVFMNNGFFLTYNKIYINEYLDKKLSLHLFTNTTHAKVIYKRLN